MVKSIIAISTVIIFLLQPCKAQLKLAELQKKFQIDRPLSDKLLVFISNNKFGVINDAGKEILPPVYSTIYNTKYNLFVVSKDSAMGIVKADNTVVLPFLFEQINILSRSRAHVLKNGIPVIVNLENKFLADTTDAPVTTFQIVGGMGLMEIQEVVADQHFSTSPPWYYNNSGIIYAVYNNDTVKTDYSNVYQVSNYDSLYKYEKNGKFGLIDNKQTVYTEAIYDYINDIYKSSLLEVSVNKRPGIYNFSNGKLNVVLNEPVSILEGFNKDDIAIVTVIRDYLGYGLLKPDGSYLLSPIKGTIFKHGESFFGIRYDTTGRTDIVDKNLHSILPPGTSVTGYVGNQFLITDTGKKMGAFHAAGYILVPPIYDELFFGNTDEEDNICSQARKGNKWGLVDLQGNIVIPFIYDRMRLFEKGLCVVEKDKKTGVINFKNKTIVPFIYDHASSYFNGYGLLGVQKKGLYGMVDRTGKVILPLVYDQVDDSFEGGLAQVLKAGKWGFVNTKGKIIIPLEYDEVQPFYSDITKVRKGTAWFNIGKTGKIVE